MEELKSPSQSPTADRLLHFGMSVYPAYHCGAAERLMHLFVDCPFVQPLLDWFTTLFNCAQPKAPRPTSTDILWTFPTAAKVPAGFLALLAIIRHQIWIARNSSRFDGLKPEPEISLKRIKSPSHLLFRVQQCHCLVTTFEQEWLAGGVFGSLQPDGSLSFQAELHS